MCGLCGQILHPVLLAIGFLVVYLFLLCFFFRLFLAMQFVTVASSLSAVTRGLGRTPRALGLFGALAAV